MPSRILDRFYPPHHQDTTVELCKNCKLISYYLRPYRYIVIRLYYNGIMRLIFIFMKLNKKYNSELHTVSHIGCNVMMMVSLLLYGLLLAVVCWLFDSLAIIPSIIILPCEYSFIMTLYNLYFFSEIERWTKSWSTHNFVMSNIIVYINFNKIKRRIDLWAAHNFSYWMW